MNYGVVGILYHPNRRRYTRVYEQNPEKKYLNVRDGNKVADDKNCVM
jgi:hypothetical protein